MIHRKLRSVTEEAKANEEKQTMPGPRGVHTSEYWTETEQVTVIGQVEILTPSL